MASSQQTNLSNERDADMRDKRELVDKCLKIEIMYVPHMLKNTNKTMNMARGELKNIKKTNNLKR